MGGYNFPGNFQPAPQDDSIYSPTPNPSADLEQQASRRRSWDEIQQSMNTYNQIQQASVSPTQVQAQQSYEAAKQPQRGGMFKRMLGNFLYNGGQAALRQYGMPTDFDIQKQRIAELDAQSQRDLRNAQIENFKADNTRLDAENEELSFPVEIAGLPPGTKIRRKDFASLLKAHETSLLQQLLEGGRNTRFYAGEENKDTRLGVTEAGKNQRAATINGRVLGGVYIPLTDEKGNVTGFYNNRNPSVIIPAAPGLRRSPLPTQENADRASFATITGQFEKLKQLSDVRADAIGPVAGRVGQLKSKFFGDDPEAADLYQTANDVMNQLIYLASGKQINEAEFKRLRDTFPDPNLPVEVFRVRLRNFENRMTETFARRSGKGEIPPIPGRGGGNPELSKTIEQFSPSRNAYRYSLDGGKTWQNGRAPRK